MSAVWLRLRTVAVNACTGQAICPKPSRLKPSRKRVPQAIPADDQWLPTHCSPDMEAVVSGRVRDGPAELAGTVGGEVNAIYILRLCTCW